MIDITINIRQAIAAMQSIQTKINRANDKTLAQASDTVARIMSRSGLGVKYPIDWDSEKQRRAFFATNGFGKGIPYRRDGGYEAAWKSEKIDGGYVTENVGHNAIFLAGAPSGEYAGAVNVLPTGQSHIHAGRWRLIKPVLDAVLARLPAALLEALRVEVNE